MEDGPGELPKALVPINHRGIQATLPSWSHPSVSLSGIALETKPKKDMSLNHQRNVGSTPKWILLHLYAQHSTHQTQTRRVVPFSNELQCWCPVPDSVAQTFWTYREKQIPGMAGLQTSLLWSFAANHQSCAHIVLPCLQTKPIKTSTSCSHTFLQHSKPVHTAQSTKFLLVSLQFCHSLFSKKKKETHYSEMNSWNFYQMRTTQQD